MMCYKNGALFLVAATVSFCYSGEKTVEEMSKHAWNLSKIENNPDDSLLEAFVLHMGENQYCVAQFLQARVVGSAVTIPYWKRYRVDTYKRYNQQLKLQSQDTTTEQFNAMKAIASQKPASCTYFVKPEESKKE